MIKTERKGNDFEILVSTMNQTSLSFLSRMFPNDDFKSYNILIINQTEEGKLLDSPYKNIRIINSFEKGLSLSRNLAIKHAKHNICLFADDDVSYKCNFSNVILDSFKNNKKADIITFQLEDEKGKLFKVYPNVDWHTEETVYTVNSVVITFRKESILNSGVFFNSNFGLGSTFPTADEYIFLRDALKAKLKIYFEKKTILTHKYFSSGRVLGNDEIVFARSAVIYKYSGILTYLKLLKYLYHVFMAKEITLKQIIPKYLVGLKGIRRYKQLEKKGKETR